MMDKPFREISEYFEAFIRTAQYIPNLTSQQDILRETGSVLVNFYHADLVGFFESGKCGIIEGHHWILPQGLSESAVLTRETEEIITGVLESGFLASQHLNLPDSFAAVFLPIVWENQTAAVMLIGHRATESIPRELLNIYLAVAGLVSNAITGADEEFKNIAARKHAEEALKGIQAQLAFLVSNTPVVLYHGVISDGFHLTFISDNVREQLGYDPHEFIDEPVFWADHVHPDDRNQIVQRLPLLIEKEMTISEYRILTGDGSYRWIRDEVKVVRDLNGQPAEFLGYLIDITERRNMEEALRESTERFRAVFDQTFHLMGVLDREGTLLEINSVASEYLVSEGTDPSSELGKPFWLTYWWTHDPDQQELLKRAINRALSGDVIRFEATHPFGNALVNIDFSLKPVKDKKDNTILFIAEGWDITERKKAEEGLRLKNQIFETITEGVNLVRASDGVIVYANSKFENMFRYKPGELIGKQISLVNAPDGIKTPDNTFHEIVKALEERDVWRGEVKNIRKDGTVFWCFATVTTFEHPEFGKVWISAHTDISDGKKAEAELQRIGNRNRDRLETLLKLGEMDSASEQELMDFVLDAGCRLTDSPYAFIGTMTPDETIFEIVSWSKSVMDECSVAASPIHFPIEKAGIWAESVRRREPFIVNDYTLSLPGKKGIPPGHVPITRFVAIPILEGSRIVMVAAVANKEVPYDKTDVHNLVLLMQGVWSHLRKHQTEEELRVSESRLNSVIQGSPIPQFVIDQNHRILYWNEALEKASGIRKEDVIGTTDQWKAFYDAERPCLSDLLLDDLGEKIPQWYGERCTRSRLIEGAYEAIDFFPHMGEDGTWLYFTAAPVLDSKGNSIGAVETLEDITDRKNAEKALLENQFLLEEAMDQGSMAYWELDIPKKKFTFNDRFYSLYGTTAEREGGYLMPSEVYAREFVHPDEINLVGNEIEKSIETPDPSFFSEVEHRIIRRDGEVRNVVVRYRISKDSAGRTLKSHGVNQDITARKRAEEALEAAVKLNQLIDTMSVSECMGFALDEAERLTSSQIGFFHFLNPDEQTIHLIAWSTETQKHCFIPKEPDKYYRVDKAGVWADCIRQRKPLIHNDYNSLPDKKGLPEGHVPVIRELVVPIFSEKRIVAIIGVGNKVTMYNEQDINILALIAKNTWTLIQRKRMEETIRESEEKFRDIFNNTTDSIHIHEIMDNGLPGRFVDVNEVACLMLGYTKEELLALSPLEIITSHHIPPLGTVIKDQKTLGMAKFETEHVRKDGTLIPVEVNTQVVTIQDRKVILGVVRDITDRKYAEELLRRFNEELEEKVKIRTEELNASLAEKVILLREIHHRVKNNLQIIVSLINIQSRGISDEKIRGVLRETQARVKAISIVHEKMYLENDVTRINLSGYVQSLATTMMTVYQNEPKQVRVKVEIRDVTLDIETAVPVGLILNELISNAFKHAFPEGRTGTITILGHSDREYLYLTVRDDGAGLPQGFDISAVKSIGMQLVRILVTQLNGLIELKDQEGMFCLLKIPLKRKLGEIHRVQ